MLIHSELLVRQFGFIYYYLGGLNKIKLGLDTCISFKQFNHNKLEVVLSNNYAKSTKKQPRIISCDNDGVILPEEAKRLKRLEYINQKRSIKRAKDKIVELAIMNDFSYFGTITISDEKHDINKPENILNYLLKVIDNFKQRYSKELLYIIVPEYGEKKGRLHFHFLMKNIPEKYIVFNEHNKLDFPYFRERFGWIQISKIGDTDKDKLKSSVYCSKYITKDNIQINSHRYFSSKGLKTAEKKTLHNSIIALSAKEHIYENKENLRIYSDNRFCIAASIEGEKNIIPFVEHIEECYNNIIINLTEKLEILAESDDKSDEVFTLIKTKRCYIKARRAFLNQFPFYNPIGIMGKNLTLERI